MTIPLVVIPFFLMGAFVGLYNTLHFRLVEEPFALSTFAVGLVFLAYLAGTLSSALAGRLTNRLGRPSVFFVGTVAMMVGMQLMLPEITLLPVIVAGLTVFTAGFFAAHAVASGAHATQASALYVCFYYAGSSLLGAWVTSAWETGGWIAVMLWIVILIAFGSSVASPRGAEAQRASVSGLDQSLHAADKCSIAATDLT